MAFSYTIERNFLTKEECDMILKFSLENLILTPSEVIYNNIKDINGVRESNQIFYPYYIKFPFLLEKTNKLLNKHINVKGYDLDYKNKEFQFTEYKKGGHFDWHKDINIEKNTNYDRYCSLVIQLNDEYEDGDLQLKNSNDEIITVEKGIGNLILFLSDIEHRVVPVKNGVRYTIVNWIWLKEKKEYKKTLL